MKAAIYARKSNVQEGGDDAKSVTRQVEGGRKYAEAKSWTVDGSAVYVDDATSGVLYRKRPEFQRLMRDARAGAFEAVLLFALDRFGRRARKTLAALNELRDLDVKVVFYATDQLVDMDSMQGRIYMTVLAEAAEAAFEDGRLRTKAQLDRQWEQGRVVGSLVYGYVNVRVGPNHVERRIKDDEAAVVREIYAKFAAGETKRRIAAALNARGVAAPRGKTWAVSTVATMLRSYLYRGREAWQVTRVVYDREIPKERRKGSDGEDREKAQLKGAEANVKWREVPDLRLVDEATAATVDGILKRNREASAASKAKAAVEGGARNPQNSHARFLLSGGLLVCPDCGGNFEARKWPTKSRYVCSTRRHRPGVCPNLLSLDVEATDEAVLGVIQDEVLTPRFTEEVLLLLGDAPPDEAATLAAERDRLREEHDRLVGSVAKGMPAESVAPLVRKTLEEISRLEVRIRDVSGRRPTPGELDDLRKSLEERRALWGHQLRGDTRVARRILRGLIGPIKLHSERPKWLRPHSWLPAPGVAKADLLARTEADLKRQAVRWRALATARGLLEGTGFSAQGAKAAPEIGGDL